MAMFSLLFHPASFAVVSAVKKEMEDFYKVFGAPIYTIKQGERQYPLGEGSSSYSQGSMPPFAGPIFLDFIGASRLSWKGIHKECLRRRDETSSLKAIDPDCQ
jgi:hypothetical protein